MPYFYQIDEQSGFMFTIEILLLIKRTVRVALGVGNIHLDADNPFLAVPRMRSDVANHTVAFGDNHNIHSVVDTDFLVRTGQTTVCS